MKKKVLVGLILLGSFSILRSQNTTDTANSKVRGIISVNPLEALVGEVRVAYDIPIKHNISLEFGVGYIYGIYFGQIGYEGIIDGSFNTLDYKYKGLSIMSGPKFYLKKNYDHEGSYLQALIFIRNYNYEDSFNTELYTAKISTFGLKALYGYKFTIIKKIIFDIYFGVGVRKTLYKYDYHDPTAIYNIGTYIYNSITPQIGFTIGYKIVNK